MTAEAAILFAAFTPDSMPDDFRYHAPPARPADSTAMPIHMIGRPTDSCFLDATVPPRGMAGGAVPCSTPLLSARPDANLSARPGDAFRPDRVRLRAQGTRVGPEGRWRCPLGSRPGARGLLSGYSYGSSGGAIGVTVVAASSGRSPPPRSNRPVTSTHPSRAGRPPWTPTTRTTTGIASAAQQAIW